VISSRPYLYLCSTLDYDIDDKTIYIQAAYDKKYRELWKEPVSKSFPID